MAAGLAGSVGDQHHVGTVDQVGLSVDPDLQLIAVFVVGPAGDLAFYHLSIGQTDDGVLLGIGQIHQLLVAAGEQRSGQDGDDGQ